MRYRTIVADPPWAYERVPTSAGIGYAKRRGASGAVVGDDGPLRNKALGYPAMSIAEILRLPIPSLADSDCRLFLWTTNRYLPASFQIVANWGFAYRQTLVWHKRDGSAFVASIAPNTAEYLVVATRGKPERTGTLPSAVLKIAAPRDVHSRKPDAFIDLVEQVSPGPYAELFARRARFGWDYPIGDQSLGGVVA